MKARDLKHAIAGISDDQELTISVDISTSDADAYRRVFATELLGVDLGTLTILMTGASNDSA